MQSDGKSIEERALDCLEKVRETYWNSDIAVYSEEAFDELVKHLNELAHILVDSGRFKEEELFWTEESLAEAERKAKETMKILFGDDNDKNS